MWSSLYSVLALLIPQSWQINQGYFPCPLHDHIDWHWAKPILLHQKGEGEKKVKRLGN
jgi:hypothetical protein